jgi:DedD protein
MDECKNARLLRLDHRHLAFFFLGAVAVCAIFFSLGFVVGRGQAYEGVIKESPSAAKTAELKSSNDIAPESNSLLEPSLGEVVSSSQDLSTNPGKSGRKGPPVVDYRRELDFYSAVKGKKVDENFHPVADEVETGSKPGRKTIRKTVSKTQAIPVGSLQPKISPSGSLVSLQVAALKNATDADKLVKTLRSKGYSVSTVTPGSEDIRKLIRVQIGPFTSSGEAAKVKARLERDGYQIITRR